MFASLVRDPLSAPEAARYVGWYATAGSIGVYVAAAGRTDAREALTSVFRLPLAYALLAALACQLLDLELPRRALDLAHGSCCRGSPPSSSWARLWGSGSPCCWPSMAICCGG
jgi:hypothetical protein